MSANSSHPSIPWFAPEIGQRDRDLVLEVLGSNYVNDGNVTREFESRIAEWIGVKYCVAVTSGTAALALALMGFGIGPGDEVIVPDLTFIATANAVRLAGADVKLVDVEPTRFTLNIDKTKEAIGPRTRAIIPVDVNGRGADYSALEHLSRQLGLRLISDAAEGLGSQWRGQFLGSFGDAGCFSFSANKTITTGQGGMVATNNIALYHRLLELKDQGRRTQGTGGNDLHPVIGFNFKLTNLQAAVGLAQLQKLQERLENSSKRDALYRSLFGSCNDIVLPPVDTDHGEVLQWTDILIGKKDEMEVALKEYGIGCRAFWHPLHTQKPYALSQGDFSNSTSIAAQGLWLPSSFDLSQQQIEYTSDSIKKILISLHP